MSGWFPARRGTFDPKFLVIHWWTIQNAYSEEEFEAKVELLSTQYGYSYNAMWHAGQMRVGTPIGSRAIHGGGSPGLRDANTHSFGIAVPYISPSFAPRGIEGEVKLPFRQRYQSGGRTRYRDTVACGTRP